MKKRKICSCVLTLILILTCIPISLNGANIPNSSQLQSSLPIDEESANIYTASSKIRTKKYTISKQTGTYDTPIKIRIKAKKDYKIYYSLNGKFKAKKVIKSKKKKTITISSTKTLQIYAVKSSKKVTNKKLKAKAVKKCKNYTYTIQRQTNENSGDSINPSDNKNNLDNEKNNNVDGQDNPKQNIENDYNNPPEEKYGDINLYASQYEFITDNVNREKEVYFYAEYEGNASSLDLIDISTGEVLTTLFDDGNVNVNGDESASDNLYSGILNLDISDVDNVSIVAQTDNCKSNIVTLDIIEDFTDEEYEAAQYITSTVNSLVKSEEYNTASKKDKIQMAISKLQELAGIGSNSNYVLKESIHYDENTDIIYYTDLMGGFRGIDVSDSNKEDYFLAGNRNLGSETALNETNDILEMALNLRSGILTSDMERGVIIYGWSLNINHETGLFDFYSEICLDVEEYGMDMSVIQGNVQSLKTILNNQDFVGIACHGGNYSLYGQENTILEMPELTNTTADKAYAKDINNQNVIKITSSNDFDTEMQEKYYITGSFFETYYGNNGYGSDILNDTIIYIGSCHGLGDDGNVRRNLANSFLFSGAECVLGHVNSVNVTYDANIMNEVIFNLIDGNDVQEALYQAELKYGEDDVEYWERYTGKTVDKIPAYNEIVFLEQETFPYWEEYKKTSISGKITSGWNEDNVLFLENVNITLEKDGNIYRTIVTDESGSYSFPAVAPGSYTIKYEKQDYETLTKEINVNFSNNVKEDINMIFIGETGLSGHVVDSDKNFLSNVSIEISDSLNEEIVANISTDENGEYSVTLENGRYDITFSKDGYKSVTLNDVIVFNGTSTLNEIVLLKHQDGTLLKGAYVASNYNNVAAILSDGSLWTWGNNDRGQLGNGVFSDSYSSPVKIMENVKEVSIGFEYMAAIKTDGSLWTWGGNGYGKLGNGKTGDCATPEKIMDNVIDISLGDYHSAAITKDGSLWMWGSDYHSTLGNGEGLEDSDIPIKIMDNVKSVSLGVEQSAAITKDGSLWMWGSGILGTGAENEESEIPIKIIENVESVFVSHSNLGHTAAILKDGSLWTWGCNSVSGQLGQGTPPGRYYPVDSFVPVKILNNITDFCWGDSYGAAIDHNNNLWVMGYGGDVLWDIDYADRDIPTNAMSGILDISLGNFTCIAIMEDGNIYTWGSNSCGELGVGKTKSELKESDTPINIMDQFNS